MSNGAKKNELKILVLGAGGTGGYFGGRLHEGGANVTFLVRERRHAQIARDGLRIEAPAASVTLAVNTVLASDIKAEFDIIILACKAYDLESSIAAISPAIHETTCVVPLLNGIAHIDRLDEAFGKARVMGGSCQIAATLTSDGVVKSMAPVHSIVWGARESGQTAAANALGEAFAKTIVDWRISENIMLDMWEKVAFLSTLAGMTCLMRANVGEILATPDGKLLMRQYSDCAIKIAQLEGYAPRPEVLARFDSVLNSSGSTLTASMLRDLEAGNDVEADHIVGYMLNKAREHGLDDSIINVAYTHLKAYQNRRASGRDAG
jgi:2-dehydropantoate 2-reductase